MPASELRNHVVYYPTPRNLSYGWNFGSLAGMMLSVQILTGVLLAMHYTPHVNLAFVSVEHILRDVEGGWALRYLHANGASLFFVALYAHVLRGFYFGAYKRPRAVVWYSGVIILIVSMATAFMGYVLPWGQMSFWGATVITNLFSAIPAVGPHISFWIWGGFSVSNATLNRFFVLHFLLPFVILGLVLMHLLLLHRVGSSNPLGALLSRPIFFHPYFSIKDLSGAVLSILVLVGFASFSPDYFSHPDNYVEADPLVTPSHIVPEWYFLPFYAILRSIPDKLYGVLAMFSSIIILLALPSFDISVLSGAFIRPISLLLSVLFSSNVIILGWLGGQVVEDPFVSASLAATLGYFAFFGATPLAAYLEGSSSAYINFSFEDLLDFLFFLDENDDDGSYDYGRSEGIQAIDPKCNKWTRRLEELIGGEEIGPVPISVADDFMHLDLDDWIVENFLTGESSVVARTYTDDIARTMMEQWERIEFLKNFGFYEYFMAWASKVPTPFDELGVAELEFLTEDKDMD